MVKKVLNTLLAINMAIIKPLCIKLSKMNRYDKYFDETKHMNFLIKDGELLET